MTFLATVVNVMIASPGDVPEERQAAREIILEWNNMHAQKEQIVLVPMAWESHSSPRMGDRPQAIINKQLLDKCDLLVAIFWTRLGTATGEAASGTVEEITRHVTADKTAMVYFSNAPLPPANINQEQYAAVTAFRKECQGKGLFHDFSSLEQFREDFRRHLALTIQDDFSHIALADQLDFSTPVSNNNLSKEAQELLLETSKDRSGQIMWLSHVSGVQIQTNDQTFVESRDARSEAKWKAALKELQQNGLIEQDNETMYSITAKGFKFADSLNPISPI